MCVCACVEQLRHCSSCSEPAARVFTGNKGKLHNTKAVKRCEGENMEGKAGGGRQTAVQAAKECKENAAEMTKHEIRLRQMQ